MPSCNAGDTQLKSKDACPANTICYSVTTCKRAACNPEKDYNRKYLVTDAAKCAAVRITCEANAAPFHGARVLE